MGCEAKGAMRRELSNSKSCVVFVVAFATWKSKSVAHVLMMSRKRLRVSILFPLKSNICSMWRGHCKFTPEDAADVVAKTEHAREVRMTSALIDYIW
jgi:hypothetical protein